jgi:hypothetical protein
VTVNCWLIYCSNGAERVEFIIRMAEKSEGIEEIVINPITHVIIDGKAVEVEHTCDHWRAITEALKKEGYILNTPEQEENQ